MDRRHLAIHEGSHAVMAFMLGMAENIHFINMGGTKENWGFVRKDGFNLARIAKYKELQDKTIRRVATLQATSEIMYCFAGYAAEARIDSAPDWYADRIDCGEYLFNPNEDTARAISLAENYFGDGGRRSSSFLDRMAQWTDEAIADDRVWRVIESLVGELETVKVRMSAERAVRIMGEAWGERGYPPILALSRKWRRRFTTTLKA